MSFIIKYGRKANRRLVTLCIKRLMLGEELQKFEIRIKNDINEDLEADVE